MSGTNIVQFTSCHDVCILVFFYHVTLIIPQAKKAQNYWVHHIVKSDVCVTTKRSKFDTRPAPQVQKHCIK